DKIAALNTSAKYAVRLTVSPKVPAQNEDKEIPKCGKEKYITNNCTIKGISRITSIYASIIYLNIFTWLIRAIAQKTASIVEKIIQRTDSSMVTKAPSIRRGANLGKSMKKNSYIKIFLAMSYKLHLFFYSINLCGFNASSLIYDYFRKFVLNRE